MKILAIESSCDETAASVSLDGRTILSDVVYSQADMHALYGGVVPEIASRKHIEKIGLVAEQALKAANLTMEDIDAVAATCAPGLIGALLVGANFAKACAQALDKPFIPVHHIRGHVAANYIAFPDLKPPFIALVASGGHTVILDVQDYTRLGTMPPAKPLTRRRVCWACLIPVAQAWTSWPNRVRRGRIVCPVPASAAHPMTFPSAA